MPKSFFMGSVRHHLFRAIERRRAVISAGEGRWDDMLRTLTLERRDDGQWAAGWTLPAPGEVIFEPSAFRFYLRGDLSQRPVPEDPLSDNAAAADRVAQAMADQLGLVATIRRPDYQVREEVFHDAWAAQETAEHVMVREAFEAPTAPEHRFILEILGDLRGKHVLDLGAGLGEAAVYFASRGANVLACDLSLGMLARVTEVAERHGVSVETHCAPAEDTGLADRSFDIVYAGNLLHHVNLEQTLDEIHRLLRAGGTFVTWDPLAHNPLINVYRRMANAVRSADEHPLRMKDLMAFRTRFEEVNYRTFWLLTLLVFLRFFFWERVHPSRERYWKKILTDADRIGPFYRRLEAFDQRLLERFPALQRYCWNIVIWGHKPAPIEPGKGET